MVSEEVTHSLYGLYKTLKNGHFSYVCNGVFSVGINDVLLSFAEANLDYSEQSAKLKKRVYYILVESLQNITRHQIIEKQNEANAGLLIQNKEGTYYITTANTIVNTNIDVLKKKIESINSLNEEELKSLYKQILAEGDVTDKGGAGLGLIDIARKSGNKIQADFVPLDKNHTQFIMQACINENKSLQGDAADLFKKAVQLHLQIAETNLHFLHRGAFTAESLQEVLKMAEGDIRSIGDKDLAGKGFYIIAELVENMMLHADMSIDGGKSGVIAIGKNKAMTTYYFTSGNFVTAEQKEKLTSILSKLEGKSKEQLSQLSKDELNSVGLLNLYSRACRVEYFFDDAFDDYSFFTIRAELDIA